MPPVSGTSAEVAIAASPDAVWAALTAPAGRRHWLNDAIVTSTWGPGDDILIDVVLEGRVRHDLGTVLSAERPSVLRYSLWSSVSRRPDRPENRSTVTFQLRPAHEGGTLLRVTHEDITGVAAAPHAAFFWPVALGVLRDELEGVKSARLQPPPGHEVR